MHAVRKKKLIRLSLILIVLGISSALILYALRQNISLFYSPTQVSLGEAPQKKHIRIGGMVMQKSVKRLSSWDIRFKVTDFKHDVAIIYHGILPDLFREGQGVVATGFLDKDQLFHATEVLAKHDENYMPPEVRDTLAAIPLKNRMQERK